MLSIETGAEHISSSHTYITLIYSCTQDWYTVVSIIEDLFRQLKRDQPTVRRAFILRSDEAGCYHNNELIAAVHDIGKRVGINFERYMISPNRNMGRMCVIEFYAR